MSRFLDPATSKNVSCETNAFTCDRADFTNGMCGYLLDNLSDNNTARPKTVLIQR
jgi:hypothetical protein